MDSIVEKLLRIQLLKIFRGRSCVPVVDMDAPESTFLNHCGTFVMLLVHILYLCFFFVVLFLERPLENLRCFLLLNCIEINLFAMFFLEPRLQTAYGCTCTFLVFSETRLSLKETNSSSLLVTMVCFSAINA